MTVLIKHEVRRGGDHSRGGPVCAIGARGMGGVRGQRRTRRLYGRRRPTERKGM